jgi:BlaI family transcriptional regulator, penicillinase repressor
MRPKSPTLTAHELELMKIVWRHEEPVTVRDVYEELRTQRTVAYTTVLTNMKTLEQKGYLRTTQHERAHVYRSVRPKHEVIRQMVRDFVTRVFNGAGQPLVVHLLEDDHLSRRDLRDITRMMAKGKKR